MFDVAEEYCRVTGRKCLYSIMPLENIPSVVQNGILSFYRAVRIRHSSVALREVQERRDRVRIPNGAELHRYANLYMDYHNPMLYKRQDEADRLCILAVDCTVLKIPGCIMTDSNASTKLVRFYIPGEGVLKIPFEKVFEKDWNKDDYYEKQRAKAVKCAEVLIPDGIPYSYIVGAYAVSPDAAEIMRKQGFRKRIVVSPKVFYH